MQLSFNPIKYHFEWTDDGWYKWDRKEAHEAALRERNSHARELRKEGYTVRCWSLPGQIARRGGIGQGYPDVEFFVTVYMVDYSRAD